MTKKSKNESLFREVLPLTLRKGDLRKIEIIEAAIKSLGSDGIRNFTYQTVATKSKLAIAHIAYHFPSLDDLLLASIKYVYSSLHAHLTDTLGMVTDNSKVLRLYLEAHIDWLALKPEYPAAGLTLINLASVDPRFKELHSELKQIGQKRIERLYQLTAEALRIKITHKKVEDISHALQSMLMGHIVFYQSTSHGHKVVNLKKSIYSHALSLLNQTQS